MIGRGDDVRIGDARSIPPELLARLEHAVVAASPGPSNLALPLCRIALSLDDGDVDAPPASTSGAILPVPLDSRVPVRQYSAGVDSPVNLSVVNFSNWSGGT
jgi:hypothetical protein